MRSIVFTLIQLGVAGSCQYAGGPALEHVSPEPEDLDAICATDECLSYVLQTRTLVEAPPLNVNGSTTAQASMWRKVRNRLGNKKYHTLVDRRDDGFTWDETSTPMLCKKVCDSSAECLGYVLREPLDVTWKKPNCWTIHALAKRSASDGEMLHMRGDIMVLSKTQAGVPKKTFVKQDCACEARVFHVPRTPNARSHHALVRHRRDLELDSLTVEAEMDAKKSKVFQSKANKMQFLAEKGNEIAELRSKIEALDEEIATSAALVAGEKTLTDYSGIYEFIPYYFPHDVHKGLAAIGWHFFVSGKRAKKYGMQDQNKFSSVFKPKVVISSIYKKDDNKHMLYQCRSTTHNDRWHWYATTMEGVLNWIRFQRKTIYQELQASDEEEDLALSAVASDAPLMAAVYFGATCGLCMGPGGECKGTLVPDQPSDVPSFCKATSQGTVCVAPEPQLARGPYSAYASEALFGFAGEEPSLPAERPSCFENRVDATEGYEEKVIADVGGICLMPDVREIPFAKQMERVANNFPLIEKALRATVAVEKVRATARRVKAKAKAKFAVVKNFFGRWGRKQPEPEPEPEEAEEPVEEPEPEPATATDPLERERTLAELTPEDRTSFARRLANLAQAAANGARIMHAIENALDDADRIVCANALLGEIQKAGGITPKLCQNAAMRPDLVRDDFVRAKLKETQSNNVVQDEAWLLQYYEKLQVTVPVLKDGEETAESKPLLDVVKYSTSPPHAAGSVGQVDAFDVIDADFRAQTGQSRVIVKTIFESTRKAYYDDWLLMKSTMRLLGKRVPPKVRSFWDVLQPMRDSIFDEFDLFLEVDYNNRGKAILGKLTERVATGEFSIDSAISITTPDALKTSSPLVAVQTLAAGAPLDTFVRQIRGQIPSVIAWRDQVYRTILHTYGYLIVENGFFQSDPHNGNWFWDQESKTLTLIDWGGVGTVEGETRCKLANLYQQMGSAVREWRASSALEVTGSEKVAGTYEPSSISIYSPTSPKDPVLFFGFTFAQSYASTSDSTKHLWYEAPMWQIGEASPMQSTMYEKLAETSGHSSSSLEELPRLPWNAVEGGEVAVRRKGEPLDLFPYYVRAATYMGLRLNLGKCLGFGLAKPDFGPDGPGEEASELDTAETIVCLDLDEDGELRAKRVVTVEGSMQRPSFAVAGEPGARVMTSEEVPQTFTLVTTGEASKDWSADPRMEYLTEAAQQTLLNPGGEGWLEEQQTGKRVPDEVIEAMLAEAANTLAVTLAAYDSDLITLATMGLQVRKSLGIFLPDMKPEYALMFRCFAVFHGMLLDLMKDNVLTVPRQQQTYLLSSRQDRFFTTWEPFAKTALAEMEAAGECAAETGIAAPVRSEAALAEDVDAPRTAIVRQQRD